MSKLVTVFTSSHSHGSFLPAAIESVLAQTYWNFEYILIDDGSDDCTWDVMQEYAAKDPRIRVIGLDKQPTVGHLINHSVQEGSGKYWVWMPADDVFTPDLLQRKYDYAQLLPTDACIYSDYFYMNGEGTVTGTSNLTNYTPETLADAVWNTTNLIGCVGLWVPMPILRRYPMPLHLKFSEDFWWLVKATKKGVPFYHLKERLYYKRKHGDTLTKKNQAQIMEGVNKIREELR